MGKLVVFRASLTRWEIPFSLLFLSGKIRTGSGKLSVCCRGSAREWECSLFCADVRNAFSQKRNNKSEKEKEIPPLVVSFFSYDDENRSATSKASLFLSCSGDSIFFWTEVHGGVM